MLREQIIDKIANDRIGFVAQFGHDPADKGATARVPFKVDGAMGVARAVYLRPAVRTRGLFRPHLDETEFLLELRIAHDLVTERAAPGGDDLMTVCIAF